MCVHECPCGDVLAIFFVASIENNKPNTSRATHPRSHTRQTNRNRRQRSQARAARGAAPRAIAFRTVIASDPCKLRWDIRHFCVQYLRMCVKSVKSAESAYGLIGYTQHLGELAWIDYRPRTPMATTPSKLEHPSLRARALTQGHATPTPHAPRRSAARGLEAGPRDRPRACPPLVIRHPPGLAAMQPACTQPRRARVPLYTTPARGRPAA